MNRATFSVFALLGALTPLVLDSALKGVALLAVAMLCSLALCRASAATRHLMWLVAVVALLVLPLLSAALPQWRVLPDWTRSLQPAATVPAANITHGSHGTHETYEPQPMPRAMSPAPAELPSASPIPPYMAPDVPPVASHEPAPTLRDWLSPAWAAGCALLVLRLIAAHILLRRAARTCVVLGNANADAITTAFAAACSQLGIRRRVTLLIDEKRAIPVVWGVFRPRLLLPAEAREWSDEQLRSVLLHELAHIKRRDALVQWLTQIACALHWWNPFVWLAAWRLHVERERACDDLVLASGVRPSAYAEHLLHVATKFSPARWTAACGLAMARKSSLEGRLLAVLSEKLNRRGVTSALVAIALILGVGVAIPVAMLRAADEKKPDAPKTAVAADTKPRHETAQSLFRKWQARGRTDGKIPGALVGQVARKLEDFIKQSPDSDEAKKLAALRGRFDTSRDWTPTEVVELLDAVTEIAPAPVSWVELSMDFDDWNSVKTGQPLPIELTSAAWGEPDANGLRSAWLLEPRAEQYPLGSILKARVLFQNAGKAPVVFRTETWHQSDAHTARDAKGADIKIGGTFFTGITPLAVYRLMPGEYCEVGGHGIAIGAGKYEEEFSTARIGAIIEAKEGDEISLSHTVDAAKGIKFSRPGDPEDAAALWKKQIAERVAQEGPVPAAAADRAQLIRRVMLDLRGEPPTPEEIAAFTADAAPGALDRLVEKIVAQPRVEPWTGKLPTGTTKFRVIAADPNAAKAPRTASAPGRYVLGDQTHLLVSQLTEGGKRTNKAVIAFLSPDPKVASPHKPYEITLPDGIGTYGIVWDRGAGELWVMQKDLVRKYEFTNPAQVQEVRYEPGSILNIPAHLQDAMKKAFNVAGAPVQNSLKPKPEKPSSAAPDEKQPPEPGAVQPVTDGKSSALVLRTAGQEPIVILTGRALTASPDSSSRRGSVKMEVATSDKTITIRYTWPEDAPGFLDLKAGGYPVSRFDLSRGRVFFVHFEKLEFSADVFQVPAGVKVPAITSSGTLTPAAAAVTTWYTASDDRTLWECSRVLVPEGEYKNGQPLDAAAEKIVWGEVNDVGLRLGLGGLQTGASFPVGQHLPLKQYIRNDGTKTLTFSPTHIFNEGVGGEVVRMADGKKFPHKKGYPWQSFFNRVRLAPGHYIALASGPMGTTMAEKDGSSSGGMDMMAHGFTVLPGEYTLQLTHGIGQFLGRPVNFHFGDPRGAPGLGEWTGVLKSAAVPLRLVDEQVKTARAGESAEFSGRYMIAFDKGVIRLRHYNGYPNMRRTGGPWEDRSRDWKVPAADGEYVAAWAVGGKGVWVKDASGITHLIVKDVLTENGKWTLPQASGDLGGMPAGVRTALQLPPRTAPQTFDFKKLPSTPGAAKIEGAFFEMTLSPGTVLKVPHRGGGFFIESGGRAYGPAQGNPVVELGLIELLRAKLAENPNTPGLEMLRHMIADGRGPVRDCAFRLLADLKSPQAPFDFDEVFHAMIHASIEDENGSKELSPEAQQGYTWFHRLFHNTRGEWERTRPLLAAGKYQPGEKPGAEPAAVWTPGLNGMSLGVSGLPAGTNLEIGKSVPVTVYLRNDTTARVKLSVPVEHNPVIQVSLTDGTGKAHRAIYPFSSPLTGYSHHELAPGASTRVAAFDLEACPTLEEANRAEHKEGKAHNPRLAVRSGSYDLHLEYRNYQENPVPTGPASEWTGKLTAQPVPLKVAAVTEKQPAPEPPRQSSPQPVGGAKLNAATEAQLDWGEAVNGLRGAVVVRSPAAGEPEGIYLTLQNVSQAPLRFADSIKAERLRTMYVSASGRILFALSSDEPTRTDVTLQPREVAYLPMMPPAETEKEKTPEAALIEGIRKDSLQTWKVVLEFQSAPEGVWKGKLTTGEMRGAVGTEGPQPKNPQAQALFKIWQNNARLNGNIPGGLVRLLHEKVKEFIRNNEPDASGAPYAKKMTPIEPRFANAGDWKPADVVVLLDDIAAAHTIPLETTMEHLARRTLQRGLPLPATLANADWGEPLPGGLRMACVLEPRAKEYHLGSELKARIVLHNSGKDPVAFVTTGFQQPRHSARLAGGGELKLDSTFWTTLGRMESYRLEPGDYCEIYTPGLGIGAQDKDRDDWSNVRAGSWIACAAGNEVVFAPGAAKLFYENNGGDNANWWLDFISERLSREAPVPADTKEREYLLYRVVRELYGAAPSTTEGDAFAADKSPDALKNLAALLAKHPYGTRSHGLIRAGTTTFRVLPPDADAAKRPRVANNPGWFTLRDDVKFSVTRRPAGEHAVNDASIIYFQQGKDNVIHKVALPDGYNTWAAAWVKNTTVLWVSQKGLLRKLDFTDPAKIAETRYEGDKTAEAPIPADVREAIRAALDVPDAPKQIFEPLKPAAPAPAAEKPKRAAADAAHAGELVFIPRNGKRPLPVLDAGDGVTLAISERAFHGVDEVTNVRIRYTAADGTVTGHDVFVAEDMLGNLAKWAFLWERGTKTFWHVNGKFDGKRLQLYRTDFADPRRIVTAYDHNYEGEPLDGLGVPKGVRAKFEQHFGVVNPKPVDKSGGLPEVAGEFLAAARALSADSSVPLVPVTPAGRGRLWKVQFVNAATGETLSSLRAKIISRTADGAVTTYDTRIVSDGTFEKNLGDGQYAWVVIEDEKLTNADGGDRYFGSVPADISAEERHTNSKAPFIVKVKAREKTAKLTSDALLGFWRGKVNGEDLMISFHRPPVETDVQVDVYFGRATIGTLASFTIAPDGGSVALMMHGASGRVPFGTMTPGDAGALKLELHNRQRGQTEVLLTRDREEIATEPRQKEARELFAMWKITANDDGTIPGTFIGMLAEEVRAYVKANPNLDSGMKLPKLLPRFVTSRDWTAADAIKLLDDVAYYATAPIEARVAKAKLPSGPLWRTMVSFEDIPVAITNWSEVKDGLRIGMRVVEGDWRIGGKVRVELWLHNAGEKDVSFKTTGPDRQDAGVAVSAVGADGREHWAENGNVSIIAIPLHCTLPAGHVAMAKNLTLSFDAPDNKEKAWLAPKFRDLAPGQYKLRCQWNDPNPLVSIAGDWTGTLAARELPFTLAAQDAAAKAGANNAKPAADGYARAGVPIADLDAPMTWSAEQNGLYLGMRLPEDSDWRIGKEVKVELWVCNPGDKDAKFEFPARNDFGLRVLMTSKDGKEHAAGFTMLWLPHQFIKLLLPPGHAVKVREFSVVLAPPDANQQGQNKTFALAPGEYKFRCEHDLMWTIIKDADGKQLKPAADVHTGLLKSGEVDVKLVAADAPGKVGVDAAPGAKPAAQLAKLPDDAYPKSGVPIGEFKAGAVNWSAKQDGLCLAMSVAEDAEWRIGGEVKVELWVCNPGKKDVKFQHCARRDIGLRVLMKGADGKERAADIAQFDGYPVALPVLLPAGHIFKAKEFSVVFLPPGGKAAGAEPHFTLAAGGYKFRSELELPGLTGAGTDGKQRTPAEGEWRGTLKSGEVDVKLVAAANAQAAPAETDPAEDTRNPRVRKRDDWSATFLAHCKAVAESRGLAKWQPDDVIAWGPDGGGLRSGMVIAPRIAVGESLPTWLVLRNFSKEQKELRLVWSWNATQIVARDENGKALTVANLRLFGADAIFPMTLKPGDQIEMPGPPVEFGGTKGEGLACRVETEPGKVLLKFDLTNLPGPETGEITITVVAADAPAAKPAQAKPAIERATVAIAKDGAISLDREKVTLDELKARAAKNAKKWFTIRADEDVPHAKVIEVVEALKAAGVTEFSYSEARVGDGRYRVANRQDAYKFDDKHHFSICRPSDYPQFFTVSWPAEGERPACWLRTFPNVSEQTRGKWAVVWEPGANVLWWVDDSDVGKMTLTDPARVIVDREGRTNNFSRGFGLPEEVKTEFRRLGFVIGRDKTPGLETAIGGNTGGQSIVSAEIGAWGIEGTVTDANGKPLANVPVRVSTNQELKTEKTDEKGKYRAYFSLSLQLLAHWRAVTVEPVLGGFTERDMAKAGEFNALLRAGEQPQRVRIADDKDFQPGPIPRFAERDIIPSQPGVSPGTPGRADFVMLKAGEIAGEIVTADGRSAPPHWVSAATREQRPGHSAALQLSDARGRFRLKGIPANRPVILTVNPDGKPSETSKSAEEKIESAGLHQIRIILPKRGSGNGALQVERVAAGANTNP